MCMRNCVALVCFDMPCVWCVYRKFYTARTKLEIFVHAYSIYLHATVGMRSGGDRYSRLIFANEYILYANFPVQELLAKKKSECQSQIARFTRPAWDQPGSCRPQVGPMLAACTLLSGVPCYRVTSQYRARKGYPWRQWRNGRPIFVSVGFV